MVVLFTLKTVGDSASSSNTTSRVEVSPIAYWIILCDLSVSAGAQKAPIPGYYIEVVFHADVGEGVTLT